MSAARFASLLLVLAVPTVSAAGELLVTVEGELAPFTLSEQRATVRVDVDCALLSGVPPEVRVELSVTDLPPWLEADVDPAVVTASPTDCPGSRATLESLMKVFRQPSARTPLAGEAATFHVLAHAVDLQGNAYDASAAVDVQAGLVGVVTVRPGVTAPTALPGERAELTAEVVNGANAALVVRWTPDERGRALGLGVVETPVPPGSTQGATFAVDVPGDAAPGPLGLAYAWTALAGEEDVDRGSLEASVLVAARTGPAAESGADGAAAPEREAPVPGLLPGLVILAVAVAAVRRRR